jgi:hypothetical protein
VRKLIKLGLIVLGIRLFLNWRKRRQAEPEPWPATDSTDDPADELRRKLAESRDDVSADAPSAPKASIADRRAEVQEQGRAVVDEMKSSGES